MKHFYATDLNKQDAEKLKAFLKKNKIYYEPSSCYDLTHFEIKMDEKELKKVNDFLETL